MKRRFVEKCRTRHGKDIYYFRRSKAEPRRRLPDDPASDEFVKAYFAALNGEDIILPPTDREIEDRRTRSEITRAALFSLTRAKKRSAKKALPCTITREWVLHSLERNNYACALTGISFRHDNTTGGAFAPYKPSIDRLDNSKGYTPENCRIVLTAVNVMLNDWGIDIVWAVVRGLRYQARKQSRNRSPLTKIPTAPNHGLTLCNDNIFLSDGGPGGCVKIQSFQQLTAPNLPESGP